MITWCSDQRTNPGERVEDSSDIRVVIERMHEQLRKPDVRNLTLFVVRYPSAGRKRVRFEC